MQFLQPKLSAFWLALSIPYALGCNPQSGQVEKDKLPGDQQTEAPDETGTGAEPSQAESPTLGQMCGTRGAAVCSEGEYCGFEPGANCGRADAPGTCKRAQPDMMCTQQYEPVCACDGKTYGNACGAAQKGVGIDHAGECETSAGGAEPTQGGGMAAAAEGATCAGIAAIRCAEGLFCNYEVAAGGLGCDGTVADASGVCQKINKMCTREYKPVCGCDHLTYATACVAHGQGVSVLRPDMCTEKDCEAAGGRVAMGTGAAATCDDGEKGAGPVRFSSGAIPVEGALCCLSK